MAEVPPFLWSDAGNFDSPKVYAVPGAGEVIPYTATATYFNASGQAILPALRIKSAEGALLALTFPVGQTIADGDSSEVTFVPPFGSASGSSPAPPPGASGVPWALAVDDSSTLAVGRTDFSFADDFETSDATLYDTVVVAGKTFPRIRTTGFYRLTCQTNAFESNAVSGLLGSGWTFSPVGFVDTFEFEFGTPSGIGINDGVDNTWYISSMQVLNVRGAANITLARFVDSAASGAITSQATSLLVERLSDRL